MRVLELFAGTGSVGKVAKELGWKNVSLDIVGNVDIKTDILQWDYKSVYKPGDFDVIWASFPCEMFSTTRNSNLGRKSKRHDGKILTKQLMTDDIHQYGLPLLRKSEEIIDYFKPDVYFMENPATGSAKDYIQDKPMYVFDYCQFAPEMGLP
ncbi:ORF_007L [Scale drop disease virus]|uniref:ORF_007L n=1 Tax=Scale drop disease virus TaxID=1697349 RepID=A0A0K1L634_9VIRU|nr:ORF_007L [Scale drop disease virus]AKU37422.1 ORF_007L [Scale drop disease virus]